MPASAPSRVRLPVAVWLPAAPEPKLALPPAAMKTVSPVINLPSTLVVPPPVRLPLLVMVALVSPRPL